MNMLALFSVYFPYYYLERGDVTMTINTRTYRDRGNVTVSCEQLKGCRDISRFYNAVYISRYCMSMRYFVVISAIQTWTRIDGQEHIRSSLLKFSKYMIGWYTAFISRSCSGHGRYTVIHACIWFFVRKENIFGLYIVLACNYAVYILQLSRACSHI